MLSYSKIVGSSVFFFTFLIITILTRSLSEQARITADAMATPQRLSAFGLDDLSPEPVCLICWVRIPFIPFQSHHTVTYCLYKKDRWEDKTRSYPKAKSFMVPSKEVEAMHFSQIPTLCSFFCRAGKLFEISFWSILTEYSRQV